jgi:hypothetical protein
MKLKEFKMKDQKLNQYRQGDVLLTETVLTPEQLAQAVEVPRENGERLVLALGEATGHAHTVRTPGVKLLELDGVRFLHVPPGQPFELRHEYPDGRPTKDHDWLQVKPTVNEKDTFFRFDPQHEYTPEKLVRVAD